MAEELTRYTIKDLMDHGVHFGHQKMRWNPRVKPFLYDTRAGISIIDLRKTLPLLHRALDKIAEVAAENGRILFVGTKDYISSQVQQTAQDCAQFYVNHRWLGGTLTNWATITKSIEKMKFMREQLASKSTDMTKKERCLLEINLRKLERFLSGIENMKYLPDLIIILDVCRDRIAVREANNRGIPVVAIVDTNGDPEGITYPIPGNDDSRRTISFYLNCFKDSILHGIQSYLQKTSSVDSDSITGDTEKTVSSVDEVISVSDSKSEIKSDSEPQSVAISDKREENLPSTERDVNSVDIDTSKNDEVKPHTENSSPKNTDEENGTTRSREDD